MAAEKVVLRKPRQASGWLFIFGMRIEKTLPNVPLHCSAHLALHTTEICMCPWLYNWGTYFSIDIDQTFNFNPAVYLHLSICDVFPTVVRQIRVSRLGPGDWLAADVIFIVLNSCGDDIQANQDHWNYERCKYLPEWFIFHVLIVVWGAS